MLNLEEFRSWQDGVMVYSEAKRNLDKDKSMIQSIITDHLKQFFDFDEIDFSENFNRISLKYHKDCGAVIRADNIKNLNVLTELLLLKYFLLDYLKIRRFIGLMANLLGMMSNHPLFFCYSNSRSG